MKRVALGVALSFVLLVGVIASPASAENPPGYPDLIGFAWGTTVPPEPTLPADMDVPLRIRPYWDMPSVYTGDPDVSMVPMVVEIWPGLAFAAVSVTRNEGAGPHSVSGFAIGVLGIHEVVGNRHTITGNAVLLDVDGVTARATSVGAMTVIDN